MRRKNNNFGSFGGFGGFGSYGGYRSQREVTPREILVSIIIVLVVIASGVLLVSTVQNKMEEKNELYYKAVKIDNDMEMFNYAQKTEAGNALSYGEVNAVDLVSLPEINAEFMYLERAKEEYTMHTRTVTTTDSDGKTHTRTETYYSWDYSGSHVVKSKELSIFGNNYSVSKFKLDNLVQMLKVTNGLFVKSKGFNKLQGGYVYKDSDTRYYYKYIPENLHGNFLVNFKYKTIEPVDGNRIEINYGTIEQRIDSLQKSVSIAGIRIWVVIGILTIVGIVFFVKGYHHWLERG